MHIRITAPHDGTGVADLDIPLDPEEAITAPNGLLEFIHEYLALYGVTYRVVTQPCAEVMKARIVTDYEIPMEFEVRA
jgi:hypothetical protein